MAKPRRTDDDPGDNLPPPDPVDVYPPPTSDAAGERTTSGVSPAAQVSHSPDEATPDAPPPAPTAGAAMAAADAELVALRAENAALKAKHEPPPAKAPADGRPQCKWDVSVPGHALPAETVEAADEAGAAQAYKAKHGITSLPVPPSVTKSEG